MNIYVVVILILLNLKYNYILKLEP